MANWKSHLEIKDLHDAYERGDLTVQDLSELLAARLKENRYAKEDEIQEIIADFEALADDRYATADEYDDILSLLYDFGDDNRRIRINTL